MWVTPEIAPIQQFVGLSNERGPIAMGKAADMIALPGNPLDDIYQLKKVNFVMKDGKVVRGR